MIMIRAIVRPEKVDTVLANLNDAGFPAVTKIDVVGRGKQRGVKVGDVVYDQIPKVMVMMVVRDEDKEDVISVIRSTALTGSQGAFGDGKIFVSPVEEAYTISTGQASL